MQGINKLRLQVKIAGVEIDILLVKSNLIININLERVYSVNSLLGNYFA